VRSRGFPIAPINSVRSGGALSGIVRRPERAERDSLKIVHCWTAEPDEAVQRGRLHLGEYQERGFDSLLFPPALGAQAWLNSCHITVVSSNVHDVVGTETLCPEKATVAGP